MLKTKKSYLYIFAIFITLIPTIVVAQDKDFTKINNQDQLESLKKNLFLEAVSEPEDGLIYELYLDLDKKTDNIKGVLRTGDEQPLYYSMNKLIEKKEISMCHRFFDTMYLGIEKDFSKKTGGTLYLKYLHNIFSFGNKYRIHRFDLRKEGNSWQLYSNTERNQIVDRVTLKSNIRIGQIVGVKKVEE